MWLNGEIGSRFENLLRCEEPSLIPVWLSVYTCGPSARNIAGPAAWNCRAGWLAVRSRTYPEPLGLLGSRIAVGRLHRTPDGCWNARSAFRKEGSEKMSEPSMIVAGIDTGNGKLEVYLSPTGERFSVDNSEAGIALLVRRCVKAGSGRWGSRRLRSIIEPPRRGCVSPAHASSSSPMPSL